MRIGAVCAGIAMLAGAWAQVSFKTEVKLVNVAFSVRDTGGRLVTDLDKENFEVLEDGIPQKIAFFAKGTEVPLTVGLVTDFSGSQGRSLKQHHQDLEKFMKTTMEPADRAFLVCFGNRLRLVSDYTSDPGKITYNLGRFEGGDRNFEELGPRNEFRIAGTAFYDAIYYAVTERLNSVDKGRKALLIFSDGEDNSSARHMMDAIEAAQSADVVLFPLRYTEQHGRPNARNKYGTSVMERIARETGGMDFDARQGKLSDHFKEIGRQLRNSYELAYHSPHPARDGAYHKIVIQSKRPEFNVRSKTGYYAR